MRVVWQEATGVVIALAILQACASEGHAREQVPTDVPVLSLISTCIETSGRPVSMSPEGDLWFATEDGLRIVQSSGAETTLSLDLGETSHAQAWSDSQLTLSALGELWQVHDQKLVFVPSPEEVGAISAFCADPARPNGAFVISDKGLFQRIGDAWWQWSQHDESSFGRIDYLLRSDGACMSEDGALLFVNDENEIWRVSETNASVVATLPDSAGALLSVPGLGLVTMLDGDLRVGQDWRSIGFDAGAVQSIRLGGEHLWVGVGDDVYVYWSGA
ncbi:MAG: hypothetical protein JKY56_07285 [Kofleriaceae bacterium]|nr:hypothetical protein [Kofleriaceae bacterium]